LPISGGYAIHLYMQRSSTLFLVSINAHIALDEIIHFYFANEILRESIIH